VLTVEEVLDMCQILSIVLLMLSADGAQSRLAGSNLGEMFSYFLFQV